MKTLHKSNLERKTKKTKIKMSGIDVENEDLHALVLLASSSDSFGNLREEIEHQRRDDATTEILHRIQSNAVCVVELLQKMDAILTSENNTVRARATEVLAKCVRSMSVKTTEQQKGQEQQRVRESRSAISPVASPPVHSNQHKSL